MNFKLDQLKMLLANLITSAEKIKAKKTQLISDKHNISVVKPTFKTKELAKILDVDESAVLSAIKEINDNNPDFTIERSSPYNKAPYVLTYEDCLEITKELGILSLQQRREKGEEIECKVISVHNGKGGVGKSTTSATAATHSHFDFKNRPKTCLLDGDPQGTLSHLSDEEIRSSEDTITTIMADNFHVPRDVRLSDEKQSEYRAKLEKLMIPHKLGSITILPSLSVDKFFVVQYCEAFTKYGVPEATLEGLTEEAQSQAHQDSLDKVRNQIMTVFKDCIIEPLKPLFDQIIVDTNPDTNLTTLMYLYASTHLIVPVTGRSADIDAYKSFFTVLEMLSESMMPDDCGLFEVRSLITLNRRQPKEIDDNANKIMMNMNCFSAKIQYSTAYETASEKGVPIHWLERKRGGAVSPALEQITKFYDEYKLWLGWE
ncbi:TPA: ParA family protein [Vibrio campbellii]